MSEKRVPRHTGQPGGWFRRLRGNRRLLRAAGRRPSLSPRCGRGRYLRRLVRWLGSAALRGLPLLGGLLAAGSIAAGLAFAYHAARQSPHFALREIRVQKTVHVSRAEILRRAGARPGVNLLTVDLEAIEREVGAHPWVAEVCARRELPATLVIEVGERQAVAAVALRGQLYLADQSGHVFKRALESEADGLPIVTGIEREAYERSPAVAEAEIREALLAVSDYGKRPGAARLSEVHLDRRHGLTLHLYRGGTALHLGRGQLSAKLARLDAVLAALGGDARRLRAVHLDNQARPDRVTVRLARVDEGGGGAARSGESVGETLRVGGKPTGGHTAGGSQSGRGRAGGAGVGSRASERRASLETREEKQRPRPAASLASPAGGTPARAGG